MATVKDDLGLLKPFQVPDDDLSCLNSLLNNPPTMISEDPPQYRNDKFVVEFGPAGALHHSSLASLRSGVWLLDEVVNLFGKVFVQEVSQKVYFFNSAFMGKLLRSHNKDSSVRGKPCYQEVCRWGGAIKGGLKILRELYVAINKNGNHWLLLRVNFNSHSIELWDSLCESASESNSIYLEAMLTYLYYELNEENSLPIWSQWILDWQCVDQSSNCPMQLNGNDCGVMTILNMYLASRGVALRDNTYNQQQVIDFNIRYALAYLFWSKGRLDKEKEVISQFCWT